MNVLLLINVALIFYMTCNLEYIICFFFLYFFFFVFFVLFFLSVVGVRLLGDKLLSLCRGNGPHLRNVAVKILLTLNTLKIFLFDQYVY